MISGPRIDARLVLLVISSLLLPPEQLRSQDVAGSSFEVAAHMLVQGGHTEYEGRTALQHAGGNSAGQYQEHSDFAAGVYLSVGWESDMLGEVLIGAYGLRTESTGSFNGLGRAEAFTRNLWSVGLDLGWRPRLSSGPWGSLWIPFGPTVTWQQMDLSGGHRDVYADPDALVTPDVAWTDRRWLSFGGFGGLFLTLPVSSGVAVDLGGTARFVFPNTGAWAAQEEEDILESTGNVVNLTYDRKVTFYWTARAGMSWRP